MILEGEGGQADGDRAHNFNQLYHKLESAIITPKSDYIPCIHMGGGKKDFTAGQF